MKFGKLKIGDTYICGTQYGLWKKVSTFKSIKVNSSDQEEYWSKLNTQVTKTCIKIVIS